MSAVGVEYPFIMCPSFLQFFFSLLHLFFLFLSFSVLKGNVIFVPNVNDASAGEGK